jgi:hypothetical protein
MSTCGLADDWFEMVLANVTVWMGLDGPRASESGWSVLSEEALLISPATLDGE